jgi:hypothetical protein
MLHPDFWQVRRMARMLTHVDRATRAFWRMRGRPIDPADEHAWLTAPSHSEALVGDRWLDDAARALGGAVDEGAVSAGLLPDMSALDGPLFRAAELAPAVRDFYEHTALWRMEVWTQWSPVFQPGGEAIARVWGRRVQQLALPTHPLDVARGIDSRVVSIVDAQGHQQAAAWIRTLRSTGEHVFSGYYTSQRLPASEQPSVHVTFPLESGNVQVFLQPRVVGGGGLMLSSPPGPFGSDGAYVVVEDAGERFAARAPIHETFHVYVDAEGVLRTDHVLKLWSAVVVRLHYKLTRAE